MQVYLGVLMLSFLINSLLAVRFIDFLFAKKLTLKNEVKEERKNSSTLFEKIRAKQALKAGTPIGLGLLFVVTIPLIFLFFLVGFLNPKYNAGYLSGFPLLGELAAILTTFWGFALIGLYDDLLKVFGFSKTRFFGLKRWHKFGLQWIVAFISAGILYWSLGIRFIHLNFATIYLGWYYLPLAAFIIVSFANAFDITSGLDGLGEGLLMICLISFWLISATQLDGILQLFIGVWLGALIAGLYFTVHPARAFLGNASGMAFGSTLAMVGLLSGKILPLLVIGGIFVADGGSSLIQIIGRQLFGKRIFPIAPIHHWFELIGWGEPKIVMRFWLAGIVLAITGVWLAFI